MASLEETLRDLVNLVGPSGYESEVAQYLVSHAKMLEKNVKVDTLGNVICQVNNHVGGPRVAVCAHMDEIGFIVRKVEQNGFLRVARLGGIEEKTLVGKEVLVLTEQRVKVPGIIGAKSHHLMKSEEKYSVVKIEDMYIDVGTENKCDTYNLGINVGSPVVFARAFFRHEHRVFANTIDNRAGCAILLETLRTIDKKRLHAEVYFIWSVQEEFSLRGILPAVRIVNPDLLLCIDIAPACDTPDLEGFSDVTLGGGPIVSTYSFHGRGTLAGLIPSPVAVHWVTQVAQEESIPLQRNVFFGGLTDASFAQLEQSGILSIDLGFATRYTHSPVEACDLRDLYNLEHLLQALLYRVCGKTIAYLRKTTDEIHGC
ncbi:MAG: M42 family metallopeptidase [Candidatus Methanomethyliaceae archaeon]